MIGEENPIIEMNINQQLQQMYPPLHLPQKMLEEIIIAYSKPKRYYHTISHVLEVLEQFQQINTDKQWKNPKEVYLAIVFHDAIYDYGGKDNELQSAVFARQCIQKHLHEEIDISYVQHLIKLTAIHGSLTPSDVSSEEALFLDCDMAILGSSSVRFCQYETNIEKEYTTIYSPEMYKIGRKQFLQKLASANRIFLSSRLHEQYDEQARQNLQWAIVGQRL
jgi:predicted metal-dependent HD superfamily phosphohydrolase